MLKHHTRFELTFFLQVLISSRARRSYQSSWLVPVF